MFSQGYLIDVQLCIAALWLFYALLLHRRIPLGAARGYLLGMFPVGLLLPLLRIPLLPAREVAETVFVETTVFPAPEAMEMPAVAVPAPVEWGLGLAVLYGVGVALFLGFQGVGIVRVMRRIRHTRVGEVLFSDKVAGAYSVFGRIFVDRRFEGSPMLVSILAHERSHIAHGHSFDLLWMNLWRAVLWFHPAAWHCGRLIREGNAVGPYIDLLIGTEAGIYPGTANALCYSLTKKRLKMMTLSARRSRLGGYLRLAALPLFTGALLGAFSLTAKASDPVSSQPQPTETVLPTVDTLDSKTVFEEPVEVRYLDGRKIQEPEFDTLRELLAAAKTVIKDGQNLKSKTPREQPADSVAGTKIYQTEEAITVRTTPQADTSKVPPIYIVDGVECTKSEELNTLEFESITVLKGETAIRAYGERARGGVIIVTTKNAKNSSGRYAARTVSGKEAHAIEKNNISVLSSSGDGTPVLALSQGSPLTVHTNQKNKAKNSATTYKNGEVTVYLSAKEQEEGVTVATKLLKDCPDHFYLDTENNWVRNRKPVKVILHREAVPTKTSTPKHHPQVIPDSVLFKELPGSSYQHIEN
ncbi:hypothetical protein [uncultured Rikenella sp.]|uniref:hypothetical protein n=1 Tax=uncultured Rikenella sp. TaxID=368003 RepID=UPI0025F4E9BA|nr:hypothetical protein [uncultured Rikenella sp.]